MGKEGFKMITIVTCRECHTDGPLPYKLQWEYKSEWCKQCQSHNSSYKGWDFCSDKCLKKFVNRLTEHKHKWEMHPYLSVVEEKGKPVNVLKVCSICDITEWRKATKKDYKRGKNDKLRMDNYTKRNVSQVSGSK